VAIQFAAPQGCNYPVKQRILLPAGCRKPGGQNASGLMAPHRSDFDRHGSDGTAESILRMPSSGNGPDRQTIRRLLYDDPTVRQKTAARSTEDVTEGTNGGKIRRKQTSGAVFRPTPGVENSIRGLGGGVPLPASERAYFEPRFNRDFSEVRVHMDNRANDASRSINARAFTIGSDIAFADGEYASGSSKGRRLLAHELAHVAQRNDGTVRRASYGTGTPPNFRDRTLSTVPQDERERVGRAFEIIYEIVADREGLSECRNHFAENCPGGDESTLATVWNRALIWRITDEGADELGMGDIDGMNIAYTQDGYDNGEESLAATLLHEAGHNCGIGAGATHWRAEQIAAYCIGPGTAGRNEISMAFGAYAGGGDAIALMSFRRFLGDWAGGRLRMTLGVDLSITGAAGAASEAINELPESLRTPTELAQRLGRNAHASRRVGRTALRWHHVAA